MGKQRTPVLTRRQVEDLARFRPIPYFVTTLYLDIDRTVPGGRTRPGALKGLLREARAGLEARNLTRKQRQSVEADLGVLERIARDTPARSGKAVAAFVASGADWEQVFDLPWPVKSRLLIGETPNVRVLAAALDEHPRYLVVLTDRAQARLVGVHLGRAHQLLELASDVPGQVSEGGYRGNAERGIDRHIEDHVGKHIHKVAEAAREAFGERDFDGLVLGGPAESVAALRDGLSPALRPHLAGEVPVEVTAPLDQVAAACETLAVAGRATRDAGLIDRLVEAVEATGTGVTGLAATLGALRRGAVASLLVAGDYDQPGLTCPECGFLSALDEKDCPACGRGGMRPVPYLVREIVDRATETGAQTWHISSEPAMRRLEARGAIGALLRFRLI